MAQRIPLESQIVASIIRRLSREPGCWVMKVHGSEFGRAGIPDLVGSLHGRCFGLEVKRPRLGKVSEVQRYEMQKMSNAGARVAVVESVEDACEVLGISVH